MITAGEIRSALPHAMAETDLPLPDKGSGKVRDWYPLGDGLRLFITTDRLSAFDRVLTCVPFKGQVLNQLTSWWFERTADIIPNHMLSTPDPNAMVAWEVQPFAVEVVVRGYISGVTSTSLWYRYSLGEREIYGHRFPEGLLKNRSLPEPIITPTTKGGPTGHDERLTCAQVVERNLLDARTWEEMQAVALEIFGRGQEIAKKAGLILVDTKYEFGSSHDGRVLLIDELHTPDSSRFWKADSYPERYAAGEEPENYDKEFVRQAYAEHGYRGDGPPPGMPDDLWVAACQRYVAIYEMLTGLEFEPGDCPAKPRLEANLREAKIIP